MFEIISFAILALALSFLIGIYAGHNHGFEQGRRFGHREAYAWSQKWGDLEQ